MLAGVVLVPVSASAATAADTLPTVSAMAKTYKNSEAKRIKRAARTKTVQAPRTTAPVVRVPIASAPVSRRRS
jgi:hypothetical protein